MKTDDVEIALWVFVVLVALWIIIRTRLRARAAERSYRPAHRGIAHRMAGRQPPQEVGAEEELPPAMRPEDWIRSRRQFLLTFAALVLIVSLGVVSCLRGGL